MKNRFSLISPLVIFFLSSIIVAYLGISLFPAASGAFRSPSKLVEFAAGWDGGNYISIAKLGYEGNPERLYAFFPFYPVLIKIFSFLFFGNYAFAALFVSWVSFFLAGIFLYKLIELDFSKDIARSTLINLSVFPTSFFFLVAYSESLFLFLLVSTMYLVRKNSYLGIVTAYLCGATRITCIALIAYLVVEAIRQISRKKSAFLPIITTISTVFGVGSYMVYLWFVKHDPLYFIAAHEKYWDRGQITLPFKVLVSYVLHFKPEDFLSFRSNTIISLEFFVSLIFLALIIYGIKKLPVSYTIYSIIVWSMPLSSGSTASMLRLVLLIFPCFLTMSLIRKNEIFLQFYRMLGLMLYGILLVGFVNGYWVG